MKLNIFSGLTNFFLHVNNDRENHHKENQCVCTVKFPLLESVHKNYAQHMVEVIGAKKREFLQ